MTNLFDPTPYETKSETAGASALRGDLVVINSFGSYDPKVFEYSEEELAASKRGIALVQEILQTRKSVSDIAAIDISASEALSSTHSDQAA